MASAGNGTKGNIGTLLYNFWISCSPVSPLVTTLFISTSNERAVVFPSLSFSNATSEMYLQVTSFNFACPLAIPTIGDTIKSSIGRPTNWSAIPAMILFLS